jgi:hypothetical protein
MIEGLHISQRRACSYAGLSRTSYRQPPATNETTQALSDRIVELAYQRRRFGYRRNLQRRWLKRRQAVVTFPRKSWTGQK